MAYTDTHARAAALVAKKGGAATFTKATRTYTPSTDVSTVSTSTVAGHAVRTRGNPETYEALKLTPTQAITLLFVPSTYDSEVPLGATCSWGGTTYTVRAVEPVAPDGDVLLARVVCAL